jgi:RHS repeat-associated protein
MSMACSAIASRGEVHSVVRANQHTLLLASACFAARYFYDTDNQLLGISFNNDQDCTDAGDYAYAYDPFGRRISATESGVTRYFVHDGLDCIAEMNSTPSVTKWYVRGSGLGGGIADIIAEVSPTTTNYFCYNHRGDVVTLTRPDGQVTNRFEYTAFGAPVSSFQFQGSSGIRAIAFSSKEFDTHSGLSYYGFRYYDTESGRWMTKDPAWDDAFNLYCFVRNSPTYSFDARGLATDTCGPNIDSALYDMLLEAKRKFVALPIPRRIAACTSGRLSWDIDEIIRGRLRGTGKCIDTVTIGGSCHYKWDANYVLYGLITSLCGDGVILGGLEVLAWKEVGNVFESAREVHQGQPNAKLEGPYLYPLHPMTFHAIGWSIANTIDSLSESMPKMRASYKDSRYDSCCPTTDTVKTLHSRWP